MDCIKKTFPDCFNSSNDANNESKQKKSSVVAPQQLNDKLAYENRNEDNKPIVIFPSLPKVLPNHSINNPNRAFLKPISSMTKVRQNPFPPNQQKFANQKIDRIQNQPLPLKQQSNYPPIKQQQITITYNSPIKKPNQKQKTQSTTCQSPSKIIGGLNSESTKTNRNTVNGQSSINSFNAQQTKPKIPTPPLKLPQITKIPEQTLNDKFQNTVKGSQLGDLPINTQDLYDIPADVNGLPNIGNTCYLNSILQILYSGQKLRKLIINLANKPNLIFHRLVANVFQDITNQCTYKQKRSHLLQLVQFIQNNDPKFARFKQNDAIQCLLNLLNILEEQDSTNSKLNYFKVKYQPHCKCTQLGPNILLQTYYVNSQETCITCKQKVQYRIFNSGPYLLVMHNTKTIKLRQNIKFINKDRNQLIFQNKAFVTHFGTQESGHYIAHRKIKNRWIEISDQHVRQVDFERVSKIPTITLYAFKKRKLIK